MKTSCAAAPVPAKTASANDNTAIGYLNAVMIATPPVWSDGALEWWSDAVGFVFHDSKV
jgi:hypothetical protein